MCGSRVSLNNCFRRQALKNEIRTGVKCLPKSKISNAKGIVLHDCHAEIVALRAFNRFLLDECALLAHDSTATSLFIEPRSVDQGNERSPQPFTIKNNVSIHMYCSEAPCGDASMELVMQAQEDATPWELPQLSQGHSEGVSNSSDAEMKGRGHFSELGIVRRKPGRFDSILRASTQFSQICRSI
jgi:tRNA-specific adenosine deaminase 1